ncbi:hypothetical protein [Acinetobacter soli]|uniref:hypothetical protein n=1 Tax=Acinetobacter soli TaxID=487316 RepID=UPI000E5A9735|nr:hypothetical protein [Acinetobacter soli]
MNVLFQSLQAKKPILDSAAGNAATQISEMDSNELNVSQLNQQIANLRLVSLVLVLSLADSLVENSLDEDELPSDRFAALLAGLSGSENDDDEIDDIDGPTLDVITANVQYAWATLGADTKLIDTALSGDVAEADQALQTIAEIVESNVPDSDELDDFVKEFVHGASSTEIDDDGQILDAVGKTTVKQGKFGKVIYKAIKAVRNGKITVVNKRVAGKVKLTPKQKAALNKARVKAFSSTALSKRIRSVTKGKRAGLY